MTDVITTPSNRRLLRSAAFLIVNEGLESIDIKKVADHAETSTSQFVRLFKTKDEFVSAIFEEGWAVMEKHISLNLMNLPSSLEELVECILNGILDAVESDRETVLASIVIAHASLATSTKGKLRSTEGRNRFLQMVVALRRQLDQHSLNSVEASEVLELIYGAVLHRLVLVTPMCDATSPKFNRTTFISSMRRMVRGLVSNGDTHPQGVADRNDENK